MKTVVVTGAGTGVGQAVALRFAAEGWRVALVGRTEATLAETASRAGSEALSRIGTFRCDVSVPDAAAAMGSAVLERFGTVDVLVNSAGINVPQRSFQTLALDDWHAVLATNLHGAYYCVRAFLPGMRERRTGTIVNINSDVGKMAREISGPAYVASKFAIVGLSEALALSIFPRDINTPLLDKRLQPPAPEVRATMLQPDDLAACVWLVATLPSRAIVDEISLSTR